MIQYYRQMMYGRFMTTRLRSNARGQGEKIEIALGNGKNKQARTNIPISIGYQLTIHLCVDTHHVCSIL